MQVAIAQQQSSLNSSANMIEALLAETNETLKSGNTTRTIENLLTIQRLMVRDNDNSSSTQDSMLLIRETVGAIVNGRLDLAKDNLNLINKSYSDKIWHKACFFTLPSVAYGQFNIDLIAL